VSEYRILARATGEVLLARAKWCAGFYDRFVGLMFRRTLPIDEGLIFVYGRESIVETSIHMLFVNFPIAVLWLDRDGVVIDKTLAKVWRPAYAPSRPAQYIVEASPDLLGRVEIGERLTFETKTQ
jgi:uncharacterized protein